jgi:hypothetical protein
VRRFGDLVPILTHCRQVHLDSFRHAISGLPQRTAGGPTAGEIGSVRSIPGTRFFKKNQVFAHFRPVPSWF